MKVIGKGDLIDRISEKTNLPKIKTAAVLNAFFEVVTTAMECNDDVSIPGFGSWKIQHIKERVGRNPAKNEPMIIPAHNRVSFKAGKNLKLAAEASKIDIKKTRKLKQTKQTKTKKSKS